MKVKELKEILNCVDNESEVKFNVNCQGLVFVASTVKFKNMKTGEQSITFNMQPNENEELKPSFSPAVSQSEKQKEFFETLNLGDYVSFLSEDSHVESGYIKTLFHSINTEKPYAEIYNDSVFVLHKVPYYNILKKINDYKIAYSTLKIKELEQMKLFDSLRKGDCVGFIHENSQVMCGYVKEIIHITHSDGCTSYAKIWDNCKKILYEIPYYNIIEKINNVE